MIRHIYLFKIKDKSKIDEARNKMMGLKANIPYIKDIEVEEDFRHGENSWDLCQIITFDNMEDFKRFIDEPYHAIIRKYMSSIREDGIKIDYEI